MRASPTNWPKHGNVLVCARCYAPTQRKSATQMYCGGCSAKSARERGTAWARENPQPIEARRPAMARRKSALNEAADARCAGPVSIVRPIDWPEMAWAVSLRLPFGWELSKNAIWRTGAGGHVFLRSESRAARNLLTARLREALSNVNAVEAKVYIAIHVQKPNHRGDAVNTIDTLCDCIKEALGVDDRWFCLRSVDWSVSRTNPEIVVQVAQAETEHHRVCTQCGVIKPLASEFAKTKHGLLGHGRTCSECRRLPSSKAVIPKVQP